MDVADVVDENGVIRLRAHYALGVGRHEPIPDQALAIVSGGRVVATVTSEDGAAELAPSPRSDAFGIYRISGRETGDPLTSIEQEVAVIRPASRPLILFDSNATEAELRLLSRLAGIDLLAVRMRVTENAGAIRARLEKAGLPRRVDRRPRRPRRGYGARRRRRPRLGAARARGHTNARGRLPGRQRSFITERLAPSTIGFAVLRAEEVASNLPSSRPRRKLLPSGGGSRPPPAPP